MTEPTHRTNRRGLLRASAGFPIVAAFPSFAIARSEDSDPVVALADALRDRSRGGALDAACAAMASGATTDHVLAAALLAGVREVRARHVGGKAHAMMIVGSLLDLTSGARELDARLLTLFAVDDFKRSQVLDVEENDDWKLSPRPSSTRVRDASSARREFDAAMEAWDDERADAAIVGLIPLLDTATLFDALRPYLLRSYVNIGHKVIYGALLERTLRDPRIGMRHAEPILRNLVDGLLHDRGGREVDAYERSRRLSTRVANAKDRAGAADPGESAALLRRFRDQDSDATQDLIVAAIEAGSSDATVFDAMRLRAAESFSRRPKEGPARNVHQLLPVHFVTTVHAFDSSSRASADSTLRALALLQAGAWLARHEEDIPRIAGYEPDGTRIDETPTARPVRTSLDAGIDSRDEAATRAALSNATDPVAAMKAAILPRFAAKCDEHHEIKFAAASFLEASAAHPTHRAALLSTAVRYLPGVGEPEFEGATRAKEAMNRAGLPL